MEDEDLQRNPFLVALQNDKKFQTLYNEVFRCPGTIVCIPVAKALPTSSKELVRWMGCFFFI